MDYIEIRLKRCTVFLTANEINSMLQRDPVIFQTALQRGKGILRARAARQRNSLREAIDLDTGQKKARGING